MTSPIPPREDPKRLVPSIPDGATDDARAVAWFKALLQGVHSGQKDLVKLARRELRALGVEIAPSPDYS